MVGWRVKGGYPIDPLPELRAWAALDGRPPGVDILRAAAR